MVKQDNSIVVAKNVSDVKSWLKEISELGIIAEVTPFFISSNTDELVSPGVWSDMAKMIKRLYNQYDGFVIIHKNK